MPSWELPAVASDWDRLARADGPVADRLRAVLEEWWFEMPAAAREQVAERLRRDDLGDHLGALAEIYFHRMFRRLEFAVDVDIGEDAHEHRRRPDFRITGPGALRVETTAILGDDAVDRQDRRRVDQLYDAIERSGNRDFLLDLDLREVGPQTPGRKLVARLERWLNGLHAAVAADQPTNGGVLQTTIAHAGWRLIVRAAPLPLGEPSADRKIIGSKREGWQKHRVEGERVVKFEGFKQFDDIGPLTKGLRSKAGHGYELDDEPFVIALLCAGTMAEDHEVAQALLGRASYQVGSGTGTWTGNGLWLDGNCRPRNSSVSAVLAVMNLTPLGLGAVEPRVWTNPWARRPLPPDALPWRRFDIQADGSLREIEPRMRPADVLGLHPRWPG